MKGIDMVWCTLSTDTLRSVWIYLLCSRCETDCRPLRYLVMESFGRPLV